MAKKYVSELPRAARETIARNVTSERLAQGWGQPHQLLTFAVHHLGEVGDNSDAFAVEAQPLPLDTMPGDEVWEKVSEAARRLTMLRATGETVPPPMSNFAGVLLVTEAWVSIRETLDGPAPSEDPGRREALTVTVVDLSGNWCDALTLRGDDEIKVRDVLSIGPEEVGRLLETSRLYPPLVLLACLLNPKRTELVEKLMADVQRLRAGERFDD